MEQAIITFDYADLDTETRIIIQQKTGEIRDRMRRAAHDIVEIGERLIDIQQRLAYGEWEAWLQTEFAWSDQTARRYIHVARAFSGKQQIVAFATSALYLLAAPNAPDEARDEALTRAEAGETITHQTARQIVEQHKPPEQPDPPPPPPAPDLSDILLRLSAHGYDQTGTPRTKGMTTFYTFRDRASDLDDDPIGVLELAEGELSFWLAELDSSAAYALAKQERFIDARDRAAVLGYDLNRDGARFVLTPAGQRVPALGGTIDIIIKTIEGYEKNAAKRAAAAPADEHAEDLTRSAASDRIAYEQKEARDVGRLERASSFIAAGEYVTARAILDAIEVSALARDRLLATLPDANSPRERARTFLAEQRDRLTRFSQSAMISQTTYKQALDHIQALLEIAP